MHVRNFNTVSLQDRFCLQYRECARKICWFTIFVTLYAIFKIWFFTLPHWKEEIKMVLLSGWITLNFQK